MIPQNVLDHVAQNVAHIGALSFDDYIEGNDPPASYTQPTPPGTPAPEDQVNAVIRLYQACQRVFRNTNALRFEVIERAGPRNKQCILTITKPDGAQRSYATPSTFGKKSEAKSEAAKIAITMGALDFLAGRDGGPKPLASVMTPSAATAVPTSDAAKKAIDDIEQCCLEWRAGRVTPDWVSFFDTKSAHKQGCALRIRLSLHVARVYLSDPTFDTYSDAKGACAEAAVLEGVLDFIKYGNGQTRPSSPSLSSSASVPSPPPVTVTTPWTLQGFYDSLPRPFPESFDTSDASGMNAPGWLNTMVQNARGGKFVLSFFFTSDGPPSLHGCLLKLDRPGEYKATLVDAKFPKRSDAKVAACLQAMSDGIGDYIRSITSAMDAKITPVMRSFSNGLVHAALASELCKINTNLFPHVEYDKERDAFGATLIVRLSTSPTPEQIRRYTVSIDYRNKADAKVAVFCHAAELGVVEFVRFRGETPPADYVSPYVLHAYDPELARKRKQSVCAEDAEQGRAAKKKKKNKGKQRAEASHEEGNGLSPVGSVLPNSDRLSGPSDMDLSQSVPMYGLSGHGGSYDAPMYASYPGVSDVQFAGRVGLGSGGYGVYPLLGTYGGGWDAPRVDVPLPVSGPSRAWPGWSSRVMGRPQDGGLEPGEVISPVDSDFSESSSRGEGEDEDGQVRTSGVRDKGKSKERSRVERRTDYGATHG